MVCTACNESLHWGRVFGAMKETGGNLVSLKMFNLILNHCEWGYAPNILGYGARIVLIDVKSHICVDLG